VEKAEALAEQAEKEASVAAAKPEGFALASPKERYQS